MEREAYPVLSVEEALEHILAPLQPVSTESVPLLGALGRVLAEEIIAESDVPPRDNSAMDGYAVRSCDVAAASAAQPVLLRVVADLPAGRVSAMTVGPGEAIRIMTGAPLPAGADAVVRFEDTDRGASLVGIRRAATPRTNVRAAGEDLRCNQVVLSAGTTLRPQELGLLATAGRDRVAVYRKPRVAVLATGDELVAAGLPLGPGQIHDSNGVSNAAQVLAAGGEPVLLGVARDQTDELAAKIRQGLAANVDLFITSGGVSAGEYDLVKNVLAAEGHLDFWWVNMKPGRPMAYGTLGTTPLLALPGNPVAAMIDRSRSSFPRPSSRKPGRSPLRAPASAKACRSRPRNWRSKLNRFPTRNWPSASGTPRWRMKNRPRRRRRCQWWCCQRPGRLVPRPGCPLDSW